MKYIISFRLIRSDVCPLSCPVQTLTKTITSSSGEKKQQHPIVGDYAMNWKLSAPASIRDEFIKVSELSSTQVLEGALSIFVYPQPTSDLYLKLGAGKPAGVFSYNVRVPPFIYLLSLPI